MRHTTKISPEAEDYRIASAVHINPGIGDRTKDLDQTIVIYRMVFQKCPLSKLNRFYLLSHLGFALLQRFKVSGQMLDLQDAVACYLKSLDLIPRNHPARSEILNNLGTAMSNRFKMLGKMEDLEEAIVCHRQALSLRPHGHPNRSSSVVNLANSFAMRFKQLGGIGDLEEAIRCHREALDMLPPHHVSRSAAINNLAASLSTRFERQGGVHDLEEAISYYRKALLLRPLGHPERFSSLNNLASAISMRFKEFGNAEDLEEAIAYHREAFSLLPPGHPTYPTALNNLAISINTRFEQQGRIDDQEEAITYHWKALGFLPVNHPDRSGSLINVSAALLNRFDQQSRIEDLEEAIVHLRQALDIVPVGHPSRPMSLSNLAAALSTRFQLLRSSHDLEEAITHNRRALSHFPRGHAYRPTTLNNLAVAISTRFEEFGKVEDQREAIACYHEALDIYPAGHLGRSSCLVNLADSVRTLFEKEHKEEDLKKALKYYSMAIAALPIDHPHCTLIWSSLASTHLLGHKTLFESDEGLPMAFDLFEIAVDHAPAGSKARFKAALQWAQSARHYSHDSAVRAYSQVLSLLDQCLVATPTVESQQKLLANTNLVPRSLACDAASSAIDAGELDTAVQLLEQGRTILWTKMQGHRHPLAKLRDVKPELADRFKTLSIQLEHLAMSSEPQSVMTLSEHSRHAPGGFDDKMCRHRLILHERDEVLQAIRRVDGFESFMQAITFDSLQMAAVEGPVVIVNINRYRSDAIIIRSNGMPVLVALPNASPLRLFLLSVGLAAAREANNPKQITVVLRALWTDLVSPVRDQLAALGVAEKSRIWWCPTSESCGLPLHAAGPYLPRQKNFADIYVSSYTPTISALIRARSGVASRTDVPSLLVMGQPGDNYDWILPEVREELRRLHSLDRFVNILAGEEATVDTVLSRIKKSKWVHFACHGHQEDQPFHSYFRLHGDRRLLLLDFIKADLPHAEFAFLSACHSAAGDRGTPDEVVHLAAAVQFSGFRSVVGTLWAMADIDGPDVAEDFYGYMFRNGEGGDFRDAAVALNLATRAMRRRKGMTIDRWINFVHIGA